MSAVPVSAWRHGSHSRRDRAFRATVVTFNGESKAVALARGLCEHADPRDYPRHTRRPSRMRVLVALAGAVLFIYGSLTVVVASAWGPGNSDELVSGGPELVPWYGLSGLGTLAAVIALALTPWPRRARWALLTATASLAAWTAFLFSIPD